MRIFFVLCAALAASLVFAANPPDQSTATVSPALTGTATNGTTIILSHQNQIFMKTKVSVWTGDVRVDNPQMKLRCELLTVEAPKLDEGKYNRATAETNVVIDWWDDKGLNHATSDKAVYTYVLTNVAAAPAELWQTNAFVVLSGHPVVTNSQETYRADPLVWDRINDVITSTNATEVQIFQTSSNSPGLFESPTTKPATTPKAK